MGQEQEMIVFLYIFTSRKKHGFHSYSQTINMKIDISGCETTNVGDLNLSLIIRFESVLRFRDE